MIRYITRRPRQGPKRQLQSPILLRAIAVALRDHGIPRTTFGRRAVGDPRLYDDMRNGRELRPVTATKVRAFIAALDRETGHG